jgi:hypothetical protein
MHRSPGLRAAVALVCWLGLLTPSADAKTAPTPSFGHAAIVQRSGEPTLVLDGKPVFFWGAAFFYERLPPAAWRGSMLELRALGATTLDLYVPWNWHEVADGEFDFDGHTNPRRNLREVLRLGRALGFTFIVRPGPVIRNEWRNGGYPAWLLTRPEYGMPLHDVLEGRYPATATLQNARSDDAAAEWMRNATHMRYASRWLHRALAEFRPVADRVIAVQLDDDQGAYVDNQTFPAPHLQRYLRWLDAQVRDVVGPITPTFINTYEMRVPASAPVWTMGNWYQSDVYAIGEHDRVALDLATAMLRTNRRGPLAMSEFQAGWLAQPEDPQPRPADPSNTTLALYELLGWGVHGVVDFPMQDTLAPFGWEAPFSNALYAWDAALRDPSTVPSATAFEALPAATSLENARYLPTWRFGDTIRQLGRLLAETHRLADVAVAYPGSAYPGDPSHGAIAFSRFRDDIRACTDRGTPCDVVDLRYETPHALRRFRTLVLGDAATRRMRASLLATFVRGGGHVTAFVPAEHLPGSILQGAGGTFLIAVNWTNAARHSAARQVRIAGLTFHVPEFTTGARSGRVIALDLLPARVDARQPAGPRIEPSSNTVAALSPGYDVGLLGVHPATNGASETYRADAFDDGASEVVLQNEVARALIVPDGGARAPVFELMPPSQRAPRDGSFPENAFDATGALRDDALLQPPPSTTDRIALYTHSYPAGTFNRTYAVSGAHDGSVRLSADVPDIIPGGAHFERIVSLLPGTARLTVDEAVLFGAGPSCENQRGVVLSALAVDPDARGAPRRTLFVDAAPVTAAETLAAPHGVALIENAGNARFVLAVSWRPGDVESASWQPQRSNGTLRLVLAPGWRRVTYALSRVDTLAAAVAFVEAERAWVAANPAPSSEDGEVAKRYTQSPQKRPSESSCGFESHLPQ